jgi:hypothetical protein
MAEHILSPTPRTPSRRDPTCDDLSPVGYPYASSRTPYPLSGPSFYQDKNPYSILAHKLADHLGEHLGPSNSHFETIQNSVDSGQSDNQATLTLCLLLIVVYKKTHAMINKLASKIDSMAATQIANSANLNMVAQIASSHASAFHSTPPPLRVMNKAETTPLVPPPPPLARQHYSAAIRVPAILTGATDPHLPKKTNSKISLPSHPLSTTLACPPSN